MRENQHKDYVNRFVISNENMLTDDEKQLVKMYVNGDDIRFSELDKKVFEDRCRFSSYYYRLSASKAAIINRAMKLIDEISNTDLKKEELNKKLIVLEKLTMLIKANGFMDFSDFDDEYKKNSYTNSNNAMHYIEKKFGRTAI